LYLDIFISNLLACSVAFRALAVLCSNNLLIAERLTKQAQLYLNAQGEERQILVNQIANEYDDYKPEPSKSFVASFV
jgi:hypothetical protein